MAGDFCFMLGQIAVKNNTLKEKSLNLHFRRMHTCNVLVDELSATLLHKVLNFAQQG